MHETVALCGILSVLVVLLVFLALKRWFYSWEGVLKEKKVIKEYGFSSTDESDFSQGCVKRYILVFETDDGKKMKIDVNKSKFKSAEIGGRYIKLKKSWKFRKRY